MFNSEDYLENARRTHGSLFAIELIKEFEDQLRVVPPLPSNTTLLDPHGPFKLKSMEEVRAIQDKEFNNLRVMREILDRSMDATENPIDLSDGNLVIRSSRSNVESIVSSILKQISSIENKELVIIDLKGDLGDVFSGETVISDIDEAWELLCNEYDRTDWFNRGEYSNGRFDAENDPLKFFIVNGIEKFLEFPTGDEEGLEKRSESLDVICRVFNRASLRKGTIAISIGMLIGEIKKAFSNEVSVFGNKINVERSLGW